MAFAFKFGTAGIRARLGSAEDELNRDSVRVIASAIAAEVAELSPDARTRGIVVAFDGRHESQAFAHEVCAVALAQGFVVGLFEQATPTPLLAFTTRAEGAAAGIMITASHNPAADNGIKLYLEGGRQVSAPHDQRIEARIQDSPDPALIARIELAEAVFDGRLRRLGEPELDDYLASVCALVPVRQGLSHPRFGYSGLFGVGTPATRRLLSKLGISHYCEVAAESELDADFGGLFSPNPEDPHALAGLFALAEREQLELAFAHDPDADRLAVLVRDRDDSLRALSGDEVGALIGDFLLGMHAAPATTMLASSLVSGGLLEQIAGSYGALFVRAPTGFKWIASLGRERAGGERRELLFGYEEALGYAFFSMADDKDGIAALGVLCALARELHARGLGLADKLAELSRTHGVFATRQLVVVADGRDGAARIRSCVDRLRVLSPDSLLSSGARLTDYERGTPAFSLLVFEDDAGTRVCVRPSGTEPKLKLYLHAREPVSATQDVAGARAEVEARLGALSRKLAPFLSG